MRGLWCTSIREPEIAYYACFGTQLVIIGQNTTQKVDYVVTLRKFAFLFTETTLLLKKKRFNINKRKWQFDLIDVAAISVESSE
jgi:hypothetical protein